MHKSTRKYLERRLADLNAEVIALAGLAQPILARADSPSEFGIPESRFQHQMDIVVELVRVSDILGEVTLLLELGQESEAAKRVKEGLQLLRTTDPALYVGACSPRLAARIIVGTNADKDTWVSTVSSMTYANDDDRRRTILPYLRKMLEDGTPVPTEADVAKLFTRDQAVSEQMRSGGGALASRR